MADLFIPPPYFDSKEGDPSAPESIIFSGGRGDGKSTLYEMVLSNLKDSGDVLIVSYVDFSNINKDLSKPIKLDYHIKNILTLGISELISYAEKVPGKIGKLSSEQLSYLKKLIIRFSSHKLENLEDRYRTIIEKEFPKKKIKGGVRRISWKLGRLLRQKSEKLVALKDSGSNIAQIVRTISIALLPSPGNEILSQVEKLDLLKHFVELVKALGLKSVIVLVDRVDEGPSDKENPLRLSNIIKEMLTSIQFLSIPRFAVKFFILDSVLKRIKSEVRTDRIPIQIISWDHKRLKKLLTKRLRAFSGGKVSSIKQIVEAGFTNRAEQMVLI